jgi:hypothetical protein
VRDPRDRRILFFFERVFKFERGARFERGADGLKPNRIVRIIDVNEREEVRRDSELILRFEGPDGLEFAVTEWEQIAKLPDGPDGVLRLPTPIVPQLLGDFAPERMAFGFTGRLFFVEPSAIVVVGGLVTVEPGPLFLIEHKKTVTSKKTQISQCRPDDAKAPAALSY